jgi:hypothetical protein
LLQWNLQSPGRGQWLGCSQGLQRLNHHVEFILMRIIIIGNTLFIDVAGADTTTPHRLLGILETWH